MPHDFQRACQSNHPIEATDYEALKTTCSKFVGRAHNRASEFLVQHLKILGFAEAVRQKEEYPLLCNGMKLYARAISSNALLNTMLHVDDFLKDPSFLEKQVMEICAGGICNANTFPSPSPTDEIANSSSGCPANEVKINIDAIYLTLAVLAKTFIDAVPSQKLAKGIRPLLKLLMADQCQKINIEEYNAIEEKITKKQNELEIFDKKSFEKWLEITKHAEILCQLLATNFPRKVFTQKPLQWDTKISNYLYQIQKIEASLKNPKTRTSCFDYLFKAEKLLTHAHAQLIKLTTESLSFLSNNSFFSNNYVRPPRVFYCDPFEISALSIEINPKLLKQMSKNFIQLENYFNLKKPNLHIAKHLQQSAETLLKWGPSYYRESISHKKILLKPGLHACQDSIGLHKWLFEDKQLHSNKNASELDVSLDNVQIDLKTENSKFSTLDDRVITLERSLHWELLGGRLESGNNAQLKTSEGATPQLPLSWLAHVLERYVEVFIPETLEDAIKPAIPLENHLPPRPCAIPHRVQSSSQ